MNVAPLTLLLFSTAGAAAVSCDTNDGGGTDKTDLDSTDQGTTDQSGTDLMLPGPGGANGSGGSGSGGAGGDGGPVCETASSSSELLPVYLAFAFDVSGSMGIFHAPEWWYDPVKKWQPVVAATSAFFESDASAGISASLTLFPAANLACEATSYTTPDVAMSALPASSFAQVFSDYEQEIGPDYADGNWRGGTPTTQALTGVSDTLLGLDGIESEAPRVIVLVTDGFPEGCMENDIAEVAAKAAELSSLGIRTYVIGIENPTTPPSSLPEGWEDWGDCLSGPGGGDTPCTAPNTLDDLNTIAAAGDTGSAILVNTGDPTATQADLSAAIDEIRKQSISCEVEIPPHPVADMTFEKDKIDVTVTRDNQAIGLGYDPTCEEPDSWHYDDEEDPSWIVLCATTCEAVLADPGAAISVNFLCEPREDVVR